MNTINAFEKKMREAKFASLDEARKTLSSHPLAGDYILDLLVDRGVMMVTEDGAVIGGYEVVAKDGPDNPDKPKLGPDEWKKEWPQRDLLMAYLECPDDQPSAKFRWVQKMLVSRDQPATHWITLHAIWHLMKHGFAEKSGGGYRLTEKGRDHTLGIPKVDGESTEAGQAKAAEFEAAIREMSPAMIEIIDTVLRDGPKPDCTAAEFSKEVGAYEDSSTWMERPEMRGGFNLSFVRWAQARFAERGTIA